MKNLKDYIKEGILDNADIAVNRMDNDLKTTAIYNWLTKFAVPEKHSNIRKGSSVKDWNIKINSDGTFDILSDICIQDTRDESEIEPIPFKIHKVHGAFSIWSVKIKDCINFPDIVDSIYIKNAPKLVLHDWHVKIENIKESTGRLSADTYNMPFECYRTSTQLPALTIDTGVTFGKNIIFECTYKSDSIYDRPYCFLTGLNEQKLKNIKFINIPYIILTENRGKFPTNEILNKYKNNIKDVKLISSSSYTLRMTMYNELKAGLLIRINDKFENIRVRTDVNSKILNPNEIANRLTNIQQEYQKYL